MENEESRIYAAISAVLPIVTVAIVHFFKTRAHGGFWESMRQSENGGEHMAAFFIFFYDLGQLFFFITLSCVAGLLFALKSIHLRREVTTLGYFSLSVNGAPVLFVGCLRMLTSVGAWLSQS